MNTQTKRILIIILALVALAALVTLVACDKTVSVTLDFGLNGLENETIEVKTSENLLSALEKHRPNSEFLFNGWYMPDGSLVTDKTKLTQDVTITAKWYVAYSVEYYMQDLEGQFVLSATHSQTDLFGDLGSTVTAKAKAITGYSFDESNPANVTSATLDASGITLKLYYTLNTVTLRFDSGLLSDVSGSMNEMVALYGSPLTIPESGFESGNARFEFAGWNTAKDGSGDTYDEGEEITVTSDMTLYALWSTTFSEEIWTEIDNGSAIGSEQFEQLTTITNRYGILGSTVSSTSRPQGIDTAKYELNSKVDGSVTTAVLGEDELTLVSYFTIRIFSVRYADAKMELGEATLYKYGSKIKVQAPEQDEHSKILRYSTSRTGDGVAYEFGDEVTVTSDITFYPVIEDIYFNEAGGSDKLVVNRGMTGWGAATLTYNGVEYKCRVQINKTNGHYEFYAYLVEDDEDSAIYGLLISDNLFRYRNDEDMGFFVNYSFITDEFYDYYIFFDGYGMGGYMVPTKDGTGRYFTYELVYERNSANTKFVEYHISYVSPIDPEKKGEGYLILSDEVPDGSGDEFDGSFVLLEYEGYIQYFYLLDNGELDNYYVLYLDGYGYAELLEYNITSDKYDVTLTGVYIASENYYLYGDEEYIFLSDGVSESFHFIWRAVQYDGEVIGYYMVRDDVMYGTYTAEDGTDAELYLDGYAGAMYYSNDRDPGRYGNYTYSESDDSLILRISFADELGGTMTAILNLEDHTFKIAAGNFIIVNGVLTGYEGTDTVIVIPEGVTEIAANVFNGINITSVTFPASLKKIGDHAFSNGNVSGGSPLMTAIFLGSTPPELGEDVFRWIKGSNFKIIVPDDAATAYRTAPTWKAATPSQPNGYARFVTTRYEQANKPLYEVVDGVLISYNNKDENPQNVAIVIPDDVTEIASGVFAGLTYITSVDLKNVQVIGTNAFYGCTGIKQVTFSRETQYIGARAFYECMLITKVNLGNVEIIGDEAFSRCFGLSEVVIGSKIKTIGSQAFYMCSIETNEQETEITPHDLIVTIEASEAPDMGQGVFQGSQPRVYVASFEIGVQYAQNSTWRQYLKHLRVKSNQDASTWYSIENLGMKLELGDNIVFDGGSMIGLYKWDGNTLVIAWFDYDGLSNILGILDARGTRNGNEISGIKIDDSASATSYTFALAGEKRTYTKSPTDTLEITFGSTEAKFNNKAVTLNIGNSVTTFNYQGYTYTVTLRSNLTFTYTTKKITVVTTYTAEDGSEITVHDGSLITIYGTLKNVDGVIRSTTVGWYATYLNNDENILTFTQRWYNSTTGKDPNYRVVIILNKATLTFSYDVSVESTVNSYRTEKGDIAVVTVNSTGEVISISILFKTASGNEEQRATTVSGSGNTYTITINGTVVDVDDEGNEHERDSQFNGTYTLTLNSNGSCTLTLVE